jgi:hypothetical protein
MSKPAANGEDRKNLFALSRELDGAGVPNALQIAEAISRMINTKVATAIGRHYTVCHKSPATNKNGAEHERVQD